MLELFVGGKDRPRYQDLWQSNRIEQRVYARLERRLRHDGARRGASRAGHERRASLEGVRAEPRVADQLLRICGIGHEQHSGARKTLRAVFAHVQRERRLRERRGADDGRGLFHIGAVTSRAGVGRRRATRERVRRGIDSRVGDELGSVADGVHEQMARGLETGRPAVRHRERERSRLQRLIALGGRGRGLTVGPRPVARVNRVGPIDAVPTRLGPCGGAGRTARSRGARRPAAIAPDGVRVDELRHSLGRGGCAVVRIADFVDLAVAAIDRWNVQRRGEVERILSQSLILGDCLMRGPTDGARREHRPH